MQFCQRRTQFPVENLFEAAGDDEIHAKALESFQLKISEFLFSWSSSRCPNNAIYLEDILVLARA